MCFSLSCVLSYLFALKLSFNVIVMKDVFEEIFCCFTVLLLFLLLLTNGGGKGVVLQTKCCKCFLFVDKC